MKVMVNDLPLLLHFPSSTTLADAFFLMFGELGARPTHYETVDAILADLCRQFTLERNVARERYVLDDPRWRNQRAANTLLPHAQRVRAPKQTTSSSTSRTSTPSC